MGETITIKIIKQNNARIFMATAREEEVLRAKKKERLLCAQMTVKKSSPLFPRLNILLTASGGVSKSTNQHWAKWCTGNRHQQTWLTQLQIQIQIPTHTQASQCIVSPNAWLPTTVWARSPRHVAHHKFSTFSLRYLFIEELSWDS